MIAYYKRWLAKRALARHCRSRIDTDFIQRRNSALTPDRKRHIKKVLAGYVRPRTITKRGNYEEIYETQKP